MLRRLADSVYQHLLDRFPGDRAYGPPAFNHGEMPGPIAHYLTRALEARIEPEVVRIRQSASNWFDVEHQDVRAAFEHLTDALTPYAQFPQEEWPAALERAVRNVTSFHARPARTLLDFLFVRETDRHTPEGLRHKLSYFSPYPHLEPVIEEYLRQHDPEDLGRDALSAFVEHVDEQMRVREDVDAWARLLQPLFEIAGLLPEYQGVVPVELLIAFFRDKGVAAVEHRLDRLHEMEGLDVMSLDGLRTLIREVYAPEPEQRSAAPKVRHERLVQPDAPASAPAPRPAPPPQVRASEEPAQPSPPSGAVPLWQRFQQATPPPRPDPDPAPPSRTATPTRPAAPGEARPLWMRFSETGAPASNARDREGPRGAPVELPELERLVLGDSEPGDRDRYVRELFRGSRSAYQDALERLAATSSWQEATRFIANDIFRRHQVDIYSDTAVAFTDAVEARYQTS